MLDLPNNALKKLQSGGKSDLAPVVLELVLARGQIVCFAALRHCVTSYYMSLQVLENHFEFLERTIGDVLSGRMGRKKPGAPICIVIICMLWARRLRRVNKS